MGAHCATHGVSVIVVIQGHGKYHGHAVPALKRGKRRWIHGDGLVYLCAQNGSGLGISGGMNETGIQYGLAPIVVRVGSAWTVGDFPPGFDHRAFAARRRLVVVTEHGDGVVTFREAP